MKAKLEKNINLKKWKDIFSGARNILGHILRITLNFKNETVV